MHSHKLPACVVPLRYEIQIAPDLPAGTFSGVEMIEVAVQETVNEIVMNAADLTIGEVTIQDGAGGILQGTATHGDDTERVHLVFPQALAPGVQRLSLSFAGSMSDKLRGIYRSTVKIAQSPTSSTGSDNAQNLLAVTQFEATDARRAFPCWDEPAIKAIFQLTLIIEDGLTAISNSPVVSEDSIPGTGKKAVRFAPTIRMSTYLVAFVVGKLEGSEAVRVDGTPVRIWCVPGKIRLARWAQEIAVFSFRFFQEYYGVPYPGAKLDLIAIPDFAFGAMENLGAITFRETALLVDESVATHGELERVADVVAHEIAHMWFGDLVTMAWWNGLWLNEAFATFMEMLAVDAWKPAWRRWVTFGVSRAAALAVDGLASSRPIEFEVVAPRDADAMFDVLTYEKGGAVLRMLEQYLGPQAFRDGVRRYLNAHPFGNAETSDLWRALGERCRQPIPAIMDGWIFRPGYPVVTVATDASGSLRLSQRRFTYLPLPSEGSELWQIPINLRIRMNGEVQNMRLLLSAAEQGVELAGRPEWVVVNEGGHGFYRVQYASGLLAPLANAPFEILAPEERFNLVNDAWAMTLAGHFSASEYLDLTARFREETDRNVWTALLASLSYLHRIIALNERSRLEARVRDRLGGAVARFGLTPRPGEDEITGQLRGELLRAMGTLGNDPVTHEQARNVYDTYLREPASVDPDVLTASIAVLAYRGGETEFAEFLRKFKTAKTPQEEQRYLSSLAGFRDPGLLRRTLQLTISGEVRTQDAPYLVRNLLVNIHGRELAWQFIKTHWETMQGQYPLGGLRRMCEGITALTTPALEEDVRQFFASKKISLGGKTLEQYLEQLHVAVVFCERETANLTAYLRAVGRVDGPAGSCYLTQLSVPRFHGSLPHTGTGKGVLGRRGTWDRAGLSMTNAEYFSPETLDEAAALLLAAGSQIRIQAEGTTLIVAGSEGERTLSMVLDLKRIPELNRIDYDERNGLRIGAAVPFRTILDFPPVLRLYPMLADATPPGAGDLVDQSTLGGSLGHQADAAEMAPPLICLRASAAIFGPYGWSEAGTEAWLTSSGGIVLQPGEFVVDLRFPALPPRSNGAYLRKTSQERADTVAGVGAFVVLEQDLSTCCGARLTVWGAAPTPLRVLEAERFLAGKVVGDAVLQKAGNLVARCALPVDGRMGASFHLVEELARGAIGEALGRVRKSHKL